MIIGSHVSFKKDTQLLGSVMEALSYGSTTFMFYTGAPQNTTRHSINDECTLKAIDLMKKNNIDINNVIIHAPYIVNMASNNEFAVNFLKQEIERAKQLKITKMVIHPGNALKLDRDIAINNLINNLNKIGKQNVLILIETMAGKGSEIGINFEEIKTIIDNVNYEIGVCLDTCHINDAGYDLNDTDKLLKEFDETIGLKYLKCVHINDSKNIKGSRKDRHENIGYGTIGFDNLINLIYHEKLKDVPKILETPYIDKNPPYKYEIEMIKNKKFINKDF